MKQILVFSFFLFVFSLSANPNTVNYTTYLTNKSGVARPLNGETVHFRLFADSTGGTALWSESHAVISPKAIVAVSLGSKNAFPLRQLQSSANLWLEMQVGTEGAFKRQKIVSSFFAIAANYADSAANAQNADHADQATLADSAVKAGNAASLGGTAASVYAKTANISSIKVNSAVLADSSKKSGNTDSLGGLKSTRYVSSDANGMVGIGITPAVQDLHVAGNIKASDSIMASKYCDNSGKILMRRAGNNTNIGTDVASDSLTIGAGGNRRIFIQPDGKVGIGVPNPFFPLHVYFTLGILSMDSLKNAVFEHNGSTFFIKTSSASDGVQIMTGGSIRMQIAGTTGYMGIGTTSPQSKLDVNGGLRFANDSDAASANKVGTLRYRTSGNNSYLDICMQTGASAYSWVNLQTNSW